MEYGIKLGGASGRRMVALLMAGTFLNTVTAIELVHAQAPQPARAATVADVRDLDIPAQSLAGALIAFSRQTHIEIFVDQALVAGKNAPAVSGALAPSDALNRLLAGSSLSYRFKSANTVTIVAAGSANANQPPPSDGSLLLDPIEVSGRGDRNAASGSGFQGTPDWVYQAPAAISVISRQAIENTPTRNTRDLLDNVAGVYANRSEAQNPGITINIRGLQDQGRITTMIDGARQDFQRAGHGSSQLTYVDTAFIREVDIEKSSTSGVGSAGSLGGLVNFRTLVADDLIKPGKQWGGQLNATTGTNAFNFDGSLVSAARVSDRLSILGGISHKDIGAFDIGKNGDLKLSTGTTSNGILLYSGQQVTSGILKGEARLNDDTKLTLGWVRSDSKFSTGGNSALSGLTKSDEKVVNDTFTSALDWNPDSDLVNLKARFYYNHIDDDLLSDGGGLGTGGGKIPINYTMGTVGGSIENTSRLATALGDLSLNYGTEAFRDDGKGKVNADIIDASGADASGSIVGSTGTGRRSIASGFANASLNHDDWLTISGGIRYDYYRISGNTTIYGNKTRDVVDTIYHPGEPPSCWPSPPFPPNFNCTPGTDPWTEPVYGPYYNKPYDLQVDRSDGAFLPTFTVAVKPFDWLQPFVKYSKSFRPPTIMESFFTGGHDAINGYAPNPELRPERGDTWEVGANISQNAVFTARDTVRFKIVGFSREITDYITIGRYYRSDADRYYDSFVNLDGLTRMRGVEIEGNYDLRAFYIGGSFTYNDTDWADKYIVNGPYGGTASLNGAGPPVLFVQPRLRVVVDGGLRFFDEKLTLGGRITHVAPTEPTLGSLLPATTFGSDAYTVYDLYGSYVFTDDVKLRFAVNNVTDVAYVPAVGASYYAAPGRTYTASLGFKF